MEGQSIISGARGAPRIIIPCCLLYGIARSHRCGEGKTCGRMRVGHCLKLLLSKCLGVGLDVMGAPQGQHKRKARELGMLNILANYICDLSRISNFHSYIQWLV